MFDPWTTPLPHSQFLVDAHERLSKGVSETIDKIIITASKMDKETLKANAYRFHRDTYPELDRLFLDGVPLVDIYRPRFDEAGVHVSYQILRSV